MKKSETNKHPSNIGEEPKSSINEIGALGSSVPQPGSEASPPKTPRVVRNEQGVIVSTTRRSEPKILGFINLPKRTKPTRGAKPKPSRGRGKRGKTKAPARDAGRATLRNDREARLRMANRRNAARANKQRSARRTRANTTIEMRQEHRVLKVDTSIRVGDLAHAMSKTAAAVVRKGWKLGMESLRPLTLLGTDDAATLAGAFGWRVIDVGFDEAGLTSRCVDAPALPRAPVVTVMGHVDHGKTSLLDRIRNAAVAETEAGGITQHIGAYRVALPAGDIVFFDTPGHEAFDMMRARGAQVTDIVVLVVAADDGVQPTTIEAINHARQAGVPIVVALNKIDKPGCDPERVTQALLAHGVVDEAFGGDSPVCRISAKTGEGIDALLDTVLSRAALMELRAPVAHRAHGVVIEGRVRKGHGPTAAVLVQDGTLRVGDIVVAGTTWGRVRRLMNDAGETVEHAGPSTPVSVVGLQTTVAAGEHAVVVADEAAARRICEHRVALARQAVAPSNVLDIDAFRRRSTTKVLPVVLKADVAGSIEAIRGVLDSLAVSQVQVRVVDAGLGSITDGDVRTAAAAGGIVLGFNVTGARRALQAARRDGVTVETFKIIYELADEVRRQMTARLDPVFEERRLGLAEVRQRFVLSGGQVVAGCRVLDGQVTRSARVRVVRDGTVVHEGTLSSLRNHKDDTVAVGQGHECGMIVGGFGGVAVGDHIEAYELDEVLPELG